jgi:hypothetical protein
MTRVRIDKLQLKSKLQAALPRIRALLARADSAVWNFGGLNLGIGILVRSTRHHLDTQTLDARALTHLPVRAHPATAVVAAPT